MGDAILRSFLTSQQEAGIRLASESDLLELVPLDGDPPTRYLATFRCKGLVKNNEKIQTHDDFKVGIQFSPDYLRRVDPTSVAVILEPPNTFLPNVNGPILCMGKIRPGTTLPELLYQVFEILSGKKATLLEYDALNPEACRWARNNPDRFPVDDRPLKRRRLTVDLSPYKEAGNDA